MRDDALAVVVVSYESGAHLDALVAALRPQLREEDEFVVVDNASRDGSAEHARRLGARVLARDRNDGFAAACHAGVDATAAPLILLLNPDSRPQEGCLDALRAAASEHPQWAAWQAAVMLEDGRLNSSGGVVHFLGMGWARDCERDASVLAAAPYETPFPSGAALVIRRSSWADVGGLDPAYFLYGEDLDLGLRLWLAGSGVGVIPSARVVHGYNFRKGTQKWFYLERNRWRTVLSVYPARLLALVLPALLAAELALLVLAAAQGWGGAKLRAQAATVTALGEIRRRRRLVQGTAVTSAGQFAELLSPAVDTVYLAGARQVPGLEAMLRAYWALVLRCV
jgi:N-acetylglucosaminyl-diphospho-decaprenol L-rhamnosyltransferase